MGGGSSTRSHSRTRRPALGPGQPREAVCTQLQRPRRGLARLGTDTGAPWLRGQQGLGRHTAHKHPAETPVAKLTRLHRAHSHVHSPETLPKALGLVPQRQSGQHSLTGPRSEPGQGALSPEIVPEQKRGVRSSGDQVDPVGDPDEVQTCIKSHPKKLDAQTVGRRTGLSWSPRQLLPSPCRAAAPTPPPTPTPWQGSPRCLGSSSGAKG